MAILGREFIAAPDSAKRQIVFKWPDQNIRKFTRCIVEPDAVAVFMSQGQLMGTLLGGHHQLDAKEYPFLGMFVDWATGGNAFKAELYFVGTGTSRISGSADGWTRCRTRRPGLSSRSGHSVSTRCAWSTRPS